MKQPGLFLDRDGVINANRSDYVRSWAQMDIFPQALDALAGIRDCRYKVILITNQSAVGRGIISLETAQAINRRLVQVISDHGGRVDQVLMCPHAPDDGCNCRKPLPGMILEAALKYEIDLQRSILIGDAVTDIEAGAAAGIPTLALVRSGRGREQEALARAMPAPPQVFDNLSEALNSFLPDRH